MIMTLDYMWGEYLGFDNWFLEIMDYWYIRRWSTRKNLKVSLPSYVAERA